MTTLEKITSRPSAGRPEVPGPKPTRRPELDALRLLVIFGLIPVHAAYIFVDIFDFYVRGDENFGFTIFVIFAAFWAMPLLFMTSGMALRFALRTRSAGEFVRERVTRLLIPFLFGVMVIIPPLTYFEVLGGGYDGSYWSFLGSFFDVRWNWGFPYFIEGRNWLFETGHLYFLYFLFVYSLLLLPLLMFFRRERGQRVVKAIAGHLVGPGVLVLLAVPVALLQALGAEGAGGWNRWVYLVCVLYGYLFAMDEGIMQSVGRHWRMWLASALVTIGLLFPFGSVLDEAGVDAFEGPELSAVLWRIVMGFAGWFSVLAVLGGTARALAGRRAVEEVARSGEKSRSARLGAYAQDAVLPVYILHMTVMVAIAYYVVEWPTNMILKYLVIVFSSFAGTLLLFELARRNRITRVLLGIKKR